MAATVDTTQHTTPSTPLHDQQEEGQRPQAGPLPIKPGELGYVESLAVQEQNSSTSSEVDLPARHPADRDYGQESRTDTAAPANAPEATGPSSSTSSLASSADSVAEQKKRNLLHLFKCNHKPKKPRKIGGILVTTFIKFLCQLSVAGGVIVTWVFITRYLQDMQKQKQSIPGGSSSTIFLHVLFGIATFAQLLFLERRVFRIRAERYCHLHPGEVLPSFRNRHIASDAAIALSPWNRPPLPTYAAALAQSGVGTGDVEDNLIAQEPPPAYGNTRGSAFLLSGYLSPSLRAQRPPSVHSQASLPPGRPRSYVSRDEEWEEIQDAERARRLAETLEQLQRQPSRT